jgi:sorbitol-specific phosphotransferase system component IIBC
MQLNITQYFTQAQQAASASTMLSSLIAYLMTWQGLILLGVILLVISAVSHFLGKGLIIAGIILVVMGLAINAGLVL